ncbi:major facilitator superfamily domain-containing protein 8-like [Eriocheir sinensis]|uniref:major facilitator superfamily domain-containing protein 8-like n=1 Tax=Eriocheir sinensis TaxID=95602 RepID=UPI0021C7EB81|nr:major facilitator superfamily domain-containing protein 8-like [Eriocheir sinensis]XP_050726688.1 major facilitator superfamily domain-containing protein 8-like [Eriocheir sinensis]XP_050726689.1 major facilitator superfamily domain-containing protein 8-like [Eriocheir sinensis]XP_050726691.1 major facilitator superfamily domain-containing protein 8-like [Eriocheir sinensis]XP_050726692.1 major facilitator superfamily domain-containing protein 8-like [Eriocheir sinensis]
MSHGQHMTEEAEEEETVVRTGLVSSRNEAANAAANRYHDGCSGFLLETPAERIGRRRSHLVVYTTTFVMSIGFSIVLTGVWPYLRQLEPGVSKEMLGWVIAANPLGQMIASPLMGLWGNRTGSNRGAFIATVAIFCIGNFLYAVLSLFGSAARAVMITSRFIVGISSANIAIIRSYISASTTVKERTAAVSFTSAAQATGFIIGPAIQAALAVAFSKDTSGVTNSTAVANMTEAEDEDETSVSNLEIQWNMYTATGWIGCFLGLINLILFLPCIFKEHNIATKEAHFQKCAANDETSKLPKPDYIGLSGILITFFISVMIYVLLETIMVPMCMDLYAWTDETAVMVVGIALCIAACLCLIVFIVIGCAAKIIDERLILIIGGVLSMTVGLVIFIPMGNTYPKIKNCTSVDPLPEHFNESQGTFHSFQLVVPLDLNPGNVNNMTETRDTRVKSIFQFNDTEALASDLVNNLDDSVMTLRNATVESIVKTTDASKVPTRIAQENDSITRILRRQRRHVSLDGDCEDTGCPPEQEWCLYTPIIEIPQLAVASVFSIIGYPVTFSIASALFSKILGPKPQGVWMGILTSTGSLSRVIGPIFVSYIYTELGTRWTFILLLCPMFFTLLLDLIIYKRLVPMNVVRRR